MDKIIVLSASNNAFNETFTDDTRNLFQFNGHFWLSFRVGDDRVASSGLPKVGKSSLAER